jgi:predicted deacylase
MRAVQNRKAVTSLFVMLACVFPAIAQTPGEFVLAKLSVGPGESATGFVDVPSGVDDGTKIPVSIFHGSKAGKILVITAGVHGSEYSPIIALQKLREQIDPKLLSGTVILVHVTNPPAFFRRGIYYGPDGKNLNRVFPGKPDGTITERIAHVLTEKLIRRSDYYIDVHSGDNNESLREYVVYYENDFSPREVIDTSRRMALATGIDFVKIARGRPRDLASATYTTNAALLLGKATIAIESGELGAPQAADVERSERGLLNILRELGMLPGGAVRSTGHTFVTRDLTIRSEHDGLYYSLVRRDQTVKQGDLLGYVTDVFGRRIQEVRAPFGGIVMAYTATPPISVGEPLVNIGELEPTKRL